MQTQKQVFGILGYPLKHSLSPLIHNFVLKKLGINAEYILLEHKLATAEEAVSFLETAEDLGVAGFNITSPYKYLISEILSSGHETILPCNTVRWMDGFWEKTSTDALGFDLGLRQLDKKLTDFDEFIILGSGGVVVNIIQYLFERRLSPKRPITVIRRSRQGDKKIGAVIPKGAKIEWLHTSSEKLKNKIDSSSESALFIQASSGPHQGDLLESLTPAFVDYKGSIVDLCYAPKSLLLTRHLAKGRTGQDGLAMLIEQARASQKFFWGETISYQEIFQHIDAQGFVLP